jgi:hypothetical protein
MFNALAFLLLRTTANRFAAQIKRMKQPRYALGFAAVAIYFWFILFSPNQYDNASNPLSFLVSDNGRSLVTVGVFLLFASSWASGKRAGALAFSEAEVHFLFPSPVTRRALIAFKLVRMQIAILVGAVIWTLLVRRGPGDVPTYQRTIGFWLLLANLSTHQVGAALVHASATRDGLFAQRSQRVISIGLLAISTLFAWAALDAWQNIAALPSLQGASFIAKAGAMLNQPLLHTLLSPFELLSEVAFARGRTEWLRALPFALGLLLLQIALVARANVAFEEISADASVRVAKKLARFRERGLRSEPRSSASTIRGTRLPLSPHGSPAMAIVWKNALAFLRSMKGTSPWLLLILAGPIVVVFMVSTTADFAQEAVLGTAAMLLVWSVILGPRFVRNDLRGDLTQLSLLKTFPLSGARIVAAEVASATLSLTVVQALVVIVAFVVLLFSADPPATLLDRSMVLIAAPFAFFAINAVNLSIQNGATLMFPAWMSLGMNRSAGVEAMGQNMLMALASIVLLACSLIPAAVTGTIVYLLLSGADLRTRIAALVLAAIATLLAEVAGFTIVLGKLFERTEPSALT